MPQTTLITGASGNLGHKLATHLADTHDLRLLDKRAGDDAIITADPQIDFAVVNGMSNNSEMRRDFDYTKQLVGYAPQDNISKPTQDA